MKTQPAWGVVSTIKAPTDDILNFAAHHLDLGASRVFIYLDAPNPEARAALKAHPKCRVIDTDDAYWTRRGGRPDRHQPRQTANATHCYARRDDIDWLVHIDMDEFLWPRAPIPDQLAALPPDTRSARIHPIEALAPDPTDPPPEGAIWCKAHARPQKDRRAQTSAIYPTYGDHLNGGFLSHVAGKVFVRTGLSDASLRIHNAFFGKEADPDPAILTDTALIHLHAASWEHFQQMYRFRKTQGSYRDSLKPAPLAGKTALTMHQLFSTIEEDGDENALRHFFEEVCTATPRLRDALDQYGLLHEVRLGLAAKRTLHFPQQ